VKPLSADGSVELSM